MARPRSPSVPSRGGRGPDSGGTPLRGVGGVGRGRHPVDTERPGAVVGEPRPEAPRPAGRPAPGAEALGWAGRGSRVTRELLRGLVTPRMVVRGPGGGASLLETKSEA